MWWQDFIRASITALFSVWCVLFETFESVYDPGIPLFLGFSKSNKNSLKERLTIFQVCLNTTLKCPYEHWNRSITDETIPAVITSLHSAPSVEKCMKNFIWTQYKLQSSKLVTLMQNVLFLLVFSSATQQGGTAQGNTNTECNLNRFLVCKKPQFDLFNLFNLIYLTVKPNISFSSK